MTMRIYVAWATMVVGVWCKPRIDQVVGIPARDGCRR